MIQRNFPCCFKAQEEEPRRVYDSLLDNVTMLKPDLVVLPESAMCEFGPVDQQGAVRFAEWVADKADGAALLAGGTRYADGRTYNSAALYAAQAFSAYDKVHLVPFGEFIPGDKWFPALQKLAPVGSCTPGELKLLPLSTSAGSLHLGIAICFEDTDSALVRRYAGMGARLLCFITNDSWFSNSDEALQHAWQARARAIETGLPVVRVGNSGVTGTIASDGGTSWLTDERGHPLVDRQGTMFDRVPVRPHVSSTGSVVWTPYVLLGDWPIGCAFALLIAAMIMIKYTNYAKRRSLSL